MLAQTTEEKTQLLDKAKETLKWFRSLSEDAKPNISQGKLREKILPIELIQVLLILQEQENDLLWQMLSIIFPYYQATPLECFEIREELGDEMLEKLDGNFDSILQYVKEEAKLFLTDSLHSAEKIALYQEPKTAFELMKAVDIIAVTGRPVLVKYYLKKFLIEEAFQAEPKDYAQIAETIGAKQLIRISLNKKFNPQGKDSVTKIFEEAQKHWKAENTLEQALQDWQGFDASARLKPESVEPLRALWKGEQLSITQLVGKLAQLEDEHEADELLAVLVSVTTDAKQALAVLSQSDNGLLVFHAARGLAASVKPNDIYLVVPLLFDGRLANEQRETVTNLLKQRQIKVPDLAEAVALLYARGNDYLTRNRPLNADADGNVPLWYWNETEKKPMYMAVPLVAAYRLLALRYAAQAYSLDSETLSVKQLYLITLFEQAVYHNGLDEPLDLDATGLNEKVGDATTGFLEQMLKQSIEKEYYAAAKVTAMLLGKRGNAALLNNTGTKGSLLVQAAVSKDRRLRFAALEAVMSLKPAEPYPGSSSISETLVWFSKADGQRRFIAAHPKLSYATQTSGFFLGNGYKAETAASCREAMQRAASSPDVEFVLLDHLCSKPSVQTVVQEMRNDARTAEIPIAVLSDNEAKLNPEANSTVRTEMEQYDRNLLNNPYARSISLTYPRAADEKSAAWIYHDLFAKTGIEVVPPAVRLDEARQALGWIKEVVEEAQKGRKIYHFEELEQTALDAVHSDTRIIQGLELAAVIKSGVMQSAIYESAADSIYPMELREKAAEEFERSVNTFGVLLRGKEVQRLYDRYNASEHEPKESQNLLNRLIDVVESKTLKKR
ncbi:hypothetical protein FACS1894189_5790 [Planctomycetales bacterium]|nr:hypothetical protein FACS1894189_5790 [Planctomycetales bacterium]